jgi:hypothetical protein
MILRASNTHQDKGPHPGGGLFLPRDGHNCFSFCTNSAGVAAVIETYSTPE